MSAPEPLLESYAKARKYRRFDLQFPVSLNFQSKGKACRLEGVSNNVSIGGLLLNAGAQIPLRTQVNLIINVMKPWVARPLRLNAEGKVVRVRRLAAKRFAIAVECKHPISNMKKHHSAADSAH